tara:strand:+ start:704 stop:880 length:177 start_codon:yes stop_codon:yes gene_type:complete
MEKIIKIVNSSWFKAAAVAGIGILFILEKHLLYAGFAFGFAVREFLVSLKPKCEICKK